MGKRSEMNSSQQGRVVLLALAGCMAAVSPIHADARTAEGRPTTLPAPAGDAPAVDPDQPDPNNPGDQLFFAVQIARKKGRRVLSQIRQVEGDVPTVVAATRTTLPDGTEDLYIAYDVSLFNQCVFEQHPEGRDATRAARERCAGVRGIETSLAHVLVAPTPRGRTEDNGGAITIVANTALGVRGESGRYLEHQMFFTGMGLMNVGARSEMRVYVTRVNAEYSEMSDGRDTIPGQFDASYVSELIVFDASLESLDELTIGTSGSGGGANALNAEAFPAPAVEYAQASHRLTVRVGETSKVFAYDAQNDRFTEVTGRQTATR
jgi:hypothetical protein